MVTSRFARRWNNGSLAWLGLAVSLHGVLLLIPLREWQAPAGMQTAITVQLVSQELRTDKPATPDAQAPEPARRVTAEPARRVTAQPAMEVQQADAWPPALHAVQPDSVVLKPSETPDKPVTMSTARLIDLASRMSSRTGQSPFGSQPGSPPPGRQDNSWRRGLNLGVGSPGNNRFDGMVAPAETELVDRWHAADGSNNVVIKTPGGDTLCGRAEAWDPMRPLMEPLMMFRSCGGGGKRSFTMDKRKSS